MIDLERHHIQASIEKPSSEGPSFILDVIKPKSLQKHPDRQVAITAAQFESEKGFLVYGAPIEDASPDGHFQASAGGLIWVSSMYPDGVACETEEVSEVIGLAYIKGRQEQQNAPALSQNG